MDGISERFRELLKNKGITAYMFSDESGISNSTLSRILKNRKDGTGYFSVNLSVGCTTKTYSIHRLVANHFIENPHNKKQVNHINGIKIDNRIENLEWCSNKENSVHSYRTGLSARGERKSNFKLTDRQVIEIRKSKLSQSKLANFYRVDQSLISRIKSFERRGLTSQTDY